MLPHSLPPDDGSRRLRILVVEDHRELAESLAMLLHEWGHEYVVARDGPAGLEAAAAFRPDVVLLDLGLPRLDGFEVVRQLRQRPEAAGVLVWVVTGFGQEDNRKRAREAGADLFLVKPVDPPFLSALLEHTAEMTWQARETHTAPLTGLQPNEQRSPPHPATP